MKRAILICLLLGTFTSKAAVVDTIKVFSPSMQKDIKCVTVTPDKAKSAKALPVVYLLHGYSGNYGSWVNDMSQVVKLADDYSLILVCPDGGFSSWYLDSPVDSTMRYETFIIDELIPHIDARYPTIANRDGRAITGLSMGGHGALYLSIRHQDKFGAAGSTSGGVDIRPFPNNWHMSKRLGSYAQHPENWEKNTVINQLHLLTPGSLALTIDCGTEDFFFAVNERLHEELAYRNIPHEYTTRPGAHNRKYWQNSILYHLLFFKEHFNNKSSVKR